MLAIWCGVSQDEQEHPDYRRGGAGCRGGSLARARGTFSFTAWTFTGAASKVYETGLPCCAFYATIFGLLVAIWATCLRFPGACASSRGWKRCGCGHGPFNEQLRVKLPLLFSGVSLKCDRVFVGPPFRTSMESMLIVLSHRGDGVVASAGGSWRCWRAILRWRFIITITICNGHHDAGAPSQDRWGGLLDKSPERASQLDAELARPELIFIWVLG